MAMAWYLGRSFVVLALVGAVAISILVGLGLSCLETRAGRCPHVWERRGQRGSRILFRCQLCEKLMERRVKQEPTSANWPPMAS